MFVIFTYSYRHQVIFTKMIQYCYSLTGNYKHKPTISPSITYFLITVSVLYSALDHNLNSVRMDRLQYIRGPEVSQGRHKCSHLPNIGNLVYLCPTMRLVSSSELVLCPSQRPVLGVHLRDYYWGSSQRLILRFISETSIEGPSQRLLFGFISEIIIRIHLRDQYLESISETSIGVHLRDQYQGFISETSIGGPSQRLILGVYLRDQYWGSILGTIMEVHFRNQYWVSI